MKPSWTPNRPTSKGASAYHNAVVDASWHKSNISELIKLIKDRVKENDILIDFGAGTGSSTVYLLKSLKSSCFVYLMDNSPSWLGKAYEILNTHKKVSFYLLERKGNGFMTPDDIFGRNTVDQVISANTVHLIADIEQTFKGIYAVLRPGGIFSFQSGNVLHKNRQKDILMIDSTIKEVHDIAIELIRSDKSFLKYKNNLAQRITTQANQRKIVFPEPRPIEYYEKMLELVGFKKLSVTYRNIKVKYRDWMNFLRVRRLQAGILPEIGGKEPSPREERDRDIIITRAAKIMFNKLKSDNLLANNQSFVAEWVYVQAEK